MPAMPAASSAHKRNTGPAREAFARNAARRAIEDPAKLGRAVRIVRAALEHKRLTLADLRPDPDTEARP